jgi:hypothetical protein
LWWETSRKEFVAAAEQHRDVFETHEHSNTRAIHNSAQPIRRQKRQFQHQLHLWPSGHLTHSSAISCSIQNYRLFELLRRVLPPVKSTVREGEAERDRRRF